MRVRMSAVIAIRSELEQRGDDFGRELASALVLAGERGDRDPGLMREMTAVAASEIRKAIAWLREGELPEKMIADYERACRKGFEAVLHAGMKSWDAEVEAARRAA
jgi:hypothetical protein